MSAASCCCCCCTNDEESYSDVRLPELKKIVMGYFNSERIMSIIMTLFLVASFIGTALLSFYYEYSFGDIVIVLGYLGWPVALAFVSIIRPKVGRHPSIVGIRIASYWFGIALCIIYIGFRAVLLMRCGDPDYLAAHVCTNQVCQNSQGVVIAIMVYAGVEIVVFFVAATIDSFLWRPAIEYEKRRQRAKKNKKIM
jgi:hypothetical protein